MEEKYLLAQWLNDDIDDKKVPEFSEKVDHEIFKKIKLYTSQLQTVPYNDEAILAHILASKKQKETKLISIQKNWIYKIAACLLLSFGMFFLYQNLTTENQIASNGEKINFVLPDNSQVVLNSESEIEFTKLNWDRKVQLDGEAYFKVAKGKRFEVNTSLGKVAVLGTQFDVKSRKNRLAVYCYEGRVQVNYSTYQVILAAGQSVTYEDNKQIISKVSDINPDWLQNKIAFDRENLQQVVEEIQRKYDVKIKLNLFDTSRLFTGKVPSDNLDVALDIITTAYQLKVIESTEKSIIFEKK